VSRYYLEINGSYFYDSVEHNIVAISIRAGSLYFNFIDNHIGYYGIEEKDHISITDEEFKILREIL